MSEQQERKYVFGLDIGTRNVVGTVGYMDGKVFRAVAQYSTEHDSRAMLDGQIHDIGRVGETIRVVKEQLEKQTGSTLTDVCIAAAGRVLKTVTTKVEYTFPEETVVTAEHVHTLDLLGVDQAQGILNEKNDTRYKFYVVGYTTVKYYLNDEIFSNLENHKAEKMGEEIIVTFLPEDVVDGLYAAVGLAGLSVANLTLEPIAAINVAIPENYRMLNIALVDVGAGTSDISVTKDGSIIAYGMIPSAGDELTELLVQHYLIDFDTAEKIKRASGTEKEITYEDIMGISHTIKAEEVWELLEPIVETITTDIAAKIRELNGGESVSATFIVGGGGKFHSFAEKIADKLDLPRERVALRGEEVLKSVVFEQEEIVKDPLIVTPIGICLNYYDKKNTFIMVTFNGERLKLYDNSHLTVVDAALQAGFPNESLFPKRGKEIHYTVNGKARIARGETGEPAVILLDDRNANLNTAIHPNCHIKIEGSTAGADAVCRVEDLEEYTSSEIDFMVNGKLVTCPRFVEVNGILEAPGYEIQDGDRIETRSYYTVSQLAEFMDVVPDPYKAILVNNRDADENTLVYENFEVEWDAEAIPREEAAIPRAAAMPAVTQKAAESPAVETEDKGSLNESSMGAQGQSRAGVFEAKESRTESTMGTKGRGSSGVPEVKEAEPALQDEKEEEAYPAETGTGTLKEPEAAKAASSPKPEGSMTMAAAAQKDSAAEPARENRPEVKNQPAEKQGIPGRMFSGTKTNAQPTPAVDTRPGAEFRMGSVDRMLQEGLTASLPITVVVNGESYRLDGKTEYVFVDIFDVIDFDLNAANGRGIVTLVNGENAQYTQKLSEGDKIEIYWKEN